MAHHQPQQPPQQQRPIPLDGTAANATWLRRLDTTQQHPFPPPLSPRHSPTAKRPKSAR